MVDKGLFEGVRIVEPAYDVFAPPRPAIGDHTGSISLAYATAGALFKHAATGEPGRVGVPERHGGMDAVGRYHPRPRLPPKPVESSVL